MAFVTPSGILHGYATTPVVYMHDTAGTFGLSTYSQREIQSEYVSNTSVLVGKQIDTIIVKLRHLGLTPGNVEVGIFNTDQSVKKLFGTVGASTLTHSYKDYTFSLPVNQSYSIQVGDRIGIKYTGGNNTNFVAIMTDQDEADPFDGANTYLSYYAACVECNHPHSRWWDYPTKDLYMVLEGTSATQEPGSTGSNGTGNTNGTGGVIPTPVGSSSISIFSSENPVPSLVKPSFGGVTNEIFHDGLTINGKVYDLYDYNVDVPKNIAQVNETVKITIKQQVFWGPGYWQHVALGMNFGGKEFEMYNADLILRDDKTDGPAFSDPEGYIRDFNATTTTDAQYVYTTFTFTAAKVMPDTNIMVSAWDYYKRVNNVRVHGAIQFGPDPTVELSQVPDWIQTFDTLSNLSSTLENLGYAKPHILDHIANSGQVWAGTDGGKVQWVLDTKEEKITLVISDNNGNQVYQQTEPLVKFEKVVPGPHSWQAQGQLGSMDVDKLEKVKKEEQSKVKTTLEKIGYNVYFDQNLR